MKTSRNLLPDIVKPLRYYISIRDLDFERWTYRGTTTIDVDVLESTHDIVINALELELLNASVTLSSDQGGSYTNASFNHDPSNQRVTITFKDAIPATKSATLIIEFNGKISSQMTGFYRSRYKPTLPPAKSVPHDEEGIRHWMLSTQFQACEARRAFPCFDEPNLKASFQLELEVPDDQVAISNMPVANTSPSVRQGWQVVCFEATPKMSTYLLAWGIGDFEYVEGTHANGNLSNGKTQSIPMRVYATRGLANQGHWALEQASQTIDYYADIFEVPYPLPKLDMLAVHEFVAGATENWGLITFRTNQLLYCEDETSSAAKADFSGRNRVAYVVAHELAHMWFGNLVTLDFWDELWLNEGFATWAGWLAMDHFHPAWEVWVQFAHDGMEAAFHLDSTRASHPVHVAVGDPRDINQVFDSISYLKSCSLIRMLASHLGVETFLKGVAIYLKTHAYGNSKKQDLWTALTSASGVDVASLMEPWISEVGFPVLEMTEEKHGEVRIRQSKFLSTGDLTPEDDSTVWWVPLSLRGGVTTTVSSKQNEQSNKMCLTEKEMTIAVTGEPLVLNSGATGFFRMRYPPARLFSLGQQSANLSAEEKINLIGSTAHLAFAGSVPTTQFLQLLQGFKDETHPLVWAQMLNALSRIQNVFAQDENVESRLSAFTVGLISKHTGIVEEESSDTRDYLAGQWKRQILETAAFNRHQPTLSEIMRVFNLWIENPSKYPIPPTLSQGLVWKIAIRQDPTRAVPALLNEWHTNDSTSVKSLCLQALATTNNKKLLWDEILPFTFTTVPPGDMRTMGSGLASHPAGRRVLWAYMKQHWAACVSRLGNPKIVDRFVRVSLGEFTDVAMIAEYDEFFEGKDTSSFHRSLNSAKDKIRGRAAYRERDGAELAKWLAEITDLGR